MFDLCAIFYKQGRYSLQIFMRINYPMFCFASEGFSFIRISVLHRFDYTCHKTCLDLLNTYFAMPLSRGQL